MRNRQLKCIKRDILQPRSKDLHQLDLYTMHEMEECLPMTLGERNRLRKWVYTGHDPETNPWGYTDMHGDPEDYVEAYRHHLADSWGHLYAPAYFVVKNPAVFCYKTQIPDAETVCTYTECNEDETEPDFPW